MFVIGGLYDEGIVICGNGVMLVLGVVDIEIVDCVYVKVMEFGVLLEGEFGECMLIFYGVYFCDLDGYKICICKFG